MKRLVPLLLIVLLFSFAARAEEMPKPDDRVVIELAAEDWVTAKTAHVTVNVEAAVNGNNAGSMRAEMTKAINSLARADWRLTSFNRSEDQTGLERWSAMFEARLPENELNGLADSAREASKAGMQLTLNEIDFTPTLDEMETARAALRLQIYKSASEQLAMLNGALPGRNYRIAMINFASSEDEPAPMPRIVRGQAMLMGARDAASALAAAGMPAAAPPLERAEKITLDARVVFAAAPPNEGKKQ